MTEHRRRREAGFYEPTRKAEKRAAEAAQQAAEQTAGLDEMTRAELLEHARSLNLDVNARMSKDEIRAVVDEAAG